MLARKLRCTILEVFWSTPATLAIRFKTNRPFSFQPGQFVSVVVPALDKKNRSVKRLYSLVTTPEEARKTGIYELCVKFLPGGIGSEFLARCEAGDKFEMFAPYGEFQYRPSETSSAVCFIGTGSGIAPIRSMVMSENFQQNRPREVLCLLGVRKEEERLFVDDFHKAGVEVVYAVSQATQDYTGFRGRVTDYLKSLPQGWGWHTTDYYLCGNGAMIAEVDQLLRGSHGVNLRNIHREAFSATPAPSARGAKVLRFPTQQDVEQAEQLLRRRFKESS